VTRREFVKLLLALGITGCPSGNLGVPEFLYAQGQDDSLELALQAQDFLESGNYEKSLSLLTRAKEIDPHSNWIWGLLGRVYTKQYE
jgi:Tfp pilus assembly protein PilF